MYDFISPILQWINAHPQLAGLAIFIISAAESIAIIGTIVPGTVMMTAIGTLAGSGVMPLWSTIIWAILGAVVGDGISYWIGYYYKDRLRNIWPFRSYPNLLQSGITFFHKHGGKSVFIGRFVGPVRALVPLVAGMLHMKPWRFTIANITSAIGWAPAYMLPGILLGAASLELPPDIAVHAILMLLLVGLFIILCLWFIQKLFRLVSNRINLGLTRLWSKLHNSRFFSPITTLLKHHNPKKNYGQLTLAFYFVVTLALFIYLASYIYLRGSQNLVINNFFFHLFRSLRTPLGDTIMLWTSLLGESKVLLPVIGILFIWFAWTKRWHTALHILALMVLTVASIETFKHFTHSSRPWGITLSPSSASFPSGHATMSMVFYAGFALLLGKATKQKYSLFFYILAGIIITTVCVSRLYLGAHWVTDIVGGILLGAAILMLIILSYNRQAGKNLKPFSIFTTTMLALFVSYTFFLGFSYSSLKHNYSQIDWPKYTITLGSWWNQQGENLPLYRVNRFGFSTQILNLQWVGDIEQIKQSLVKNGWETSPERNWITALHRISNIESTEHLPLVSPSYLDKDPVLVLIKQTKNKRLIALRLWDPNVIIKNTNKPLWVGTVELIPSTYSWIFKRKRTNDVNLTSKLLFANNPSNYDIKEITVLNTHRPHPERQAMVLIKPK